MTPRGGAPASRAAMLFAGLALLLCAAALYLASSSPDGLERVAAHLGFAHRARPAVPALMPDYQLPLPGFAGKAASVLAGAGVCFLAAWGVGKYSARRGESVAPGPARPLQ